jgi:hypothetical protein
MPPARRNPPLPDGPLHVLVDSTGLKVYGAGQWLEEKHGARSRRNWRKFHLAVDANSGEIIAHRLTDQDTDDPSQVQPLLSQIDGGIDQFTADGASPPLDKCTLLRYTIYVGIRLHYYKLASFLEDFEMNKIFTEQPNWNLNGTIINACK